MSSLGDFAQNPPPGSTPAAADYKSYLLNDRTVGRYRSALTEGIDRVAITLTQVDRPVTGAPVSQLESAISKIDLEQPLSDQNAALDELEYIYLRNAVYFHHPRYLGHLNRPVVIPALVGEAIRSSINSSLDTWDQSTGGTLIERRLIDWTAGRIGFSKAADDVFTSSGTQSNRQELLIARDEACASIRRYSWARPGKSEILPRLRILASEASHRSAEELDTSYSTHFS